jgi:hypothetical protein
MQLDAKIAETGTKFKVFVQPRGLPAFSEPETIRVALPPGKIQAGPADDRMFVLDAVNKKPYNLYNQRQDPHLGSKNPPVESGPEGHFDHLDIDSREFSCTTMYATVRRVLDIWEDYFGYTIEWHFLLDFERMQLIPLIEWDNAHSGYGFLEFGYGRLPDEALDLTNPYCQNFDVLAHELGHSIIFAEVRFPTESSGTDEYGGFHESAGDLVAIISSLHFHKVADHLLDRSKGNLFTINELTRVGELDKSRQIRLAFNYERMSTVTKEPHDLSKPLTGAIFDIFVEVFQKELVNASLITQDLADRSYHAPYEDINDDEIQSEFDRAYKAKAGEFKKALLKARDYLGQLLARTWSTLSPHYLTYNEVGLGLLSSDRNISGGLHQQTIRECFQWREITFPTDSIAFQPRKLSDCGII